MSSNREVLPTNVTPVSYVVDLVPGLETLKFSGKSSVVLKINENSKKIVANAHELEISSARCKFNDIVLPATISLERELQTVTLEFESEIPAGATATVEFEFIGIHNDQMAGFYRSGYTNKEGEKKFLVVTQFEATDARRCFPCWDEPNLKATFEIILNVPKDRTALSNMPVVEECDVQINGETLNRVKFAPTPIVSTYLVAMVVGEFDFIEAIAKPTKPEDAKPITCRVYTLKGQSYMAELGLSMCTKTLEYFSEYFDMAYPLPKMDMVSIPDFGAGAMENWGLVTYRETALLYDPAKSSAAAKERVAYVVAHELAHQWFGNIVTMDWWSELWLNEGFATYVGWLAVDHAYPEWEVFTSFVNGEFTRGITLDSMRSSHPIEVDVKSPAEVAQIFDAISYSKGASIIRMLSSYLGSKVFQNGVTQYLKKHTYGNARTIDLWASLAQASKQDVTKIMYSWTREMGFPLVTVESEEYDQVNKTMTLRLRQSKFLASGDLTPEEDAAAPIWSIPIPVLTNGGSVTMHLLSEKSGAIVFPYVESGTSFYKLNTGVTGFYRVQYTAKGIERLSNCLAKNLNVFGVADRIGLISDAFATARAGVIATPAALEILNGFKNEEDQRVLTEIDSKLGDIKSVWFQNEQTMSGVRALQREIFSSKAAKLGLDFSDNDDYLTIQKRSLCVKAAASGRDEFVTTELQSRFNKYVDGDHSALHPNLRATTFKTVLNHSTSPIEDFEAVLSIYKNATTADERIAALSCIGSSNDIEIAKRVLNEIALDTNLVKMQDSMYPIASLVQTNPNKVVILEMVWEWFQSNWLVLHERLSPSLALLSRIAQFSIEANIGEEFADKVRAWARGDDLSTEEEKMLRVKQVKDIKRPLDQALEKISMSSGWISKENDAVSNWFLVKGYSIAQ